MAVLRLEPAALQARYGLRFEEGADDLDRFVLAAIALPNGDQLWLMRYMRAPEPGTVVYADSAADPTSKRSELLAILEIGEDDLSWWPGSE